MEIITRKPTALKICVDCIENYNDDGIEPCVQVLFNGLLSRKARFPILEYVAELLYSEIAENEHIQLCDKIQLLRTEGGNVILGKILQMRLSQHYQQSLDKAVEYIEKADRWYVCDIIGERVLGFALLNYTEKTITALIRLSDHTSHWVVRSMGAGMHYAIKKQLPRNHVNSTFKILLQHANSNNKEIRQGIGWAAKTTAKFHPSVIEFYQQTIEDKFQVANWFRAKIAIGLERNKHAKRNSC